MKLHLITWKNNHNDKEYFIAKKIKENKNSITLNILFSDNPTHPDDTAFTLNKIHYTDWTKIFESYQGEFYKKDIINIRQPTQKELSKILPHLI